MTSVNPIETQVQAPAFKGVSKSGQKKALEQLEQQIQQLAPKQRKAFMERVAGAACAAQTKDSAILKETMLRETALGHFDFVKGINDYLSRNIAKNLYKK